MADADPVTVVELRAWLQESRWNLAALQSRRRRYLALDEAARRQFAREYGFANLTDLTQSLSAARQSVARFESWLARLDASAVSGEDADPPPGPG